MRVICVILCLIISTSVPASAGFILWSSKHVTTNLVKDEAWITEALLAEEQTVEPLMLEATDNLDDPKPEEEQESTEPQETPTEATDPTEEPIEPPVEDTQPQME